MRHVDVCNGDADGLCALQQLRLDDPRPATLVTGPKRDIALLDRVHAGAGDQVSVLDVSLEANRAALLRLLDAGATVLYVDHHACGPPPRHPRLVAHIDHAPDVCTSLLVDRRLAGRWRRWALVGAYGDGLVADADALARAAGLGGAACARLRALGEDLNYNAYGEREADLIVPPAVLAAMLRGQPDPLALDDDGTLARIAQTRADDMRRALGQPVEAVGAHAHLCRLPDAAWSRRVRGTLAHALAQRDPARGCAVLHPDAHGGWVVSVRAPLADRRGADALCRRFGGDGRAGAGGIGCLPDAALDAFAGALRDAFGPRRPPPPARIG